MSERKLLKFPPNFLWGVSTSAYQTEGGNINDWSEWEKTRLRQGFGGQARGADGNSEDYICGKACDSYNCYEEDFDLAKGLNCGAFRLGLEWSRIEPRKGEFDFKEILHYREVLRAAKDRNLKIVLTLWHWTNPLWFAAEGGWAGKNAVKYFSCYAELIVRELGEFVDYWVTINEPMVHLFNGYLKGKFPPNRKDFVLAFKVYNNLIKAHLSAYEIIHKKFPVAQVGLTMLANFFEPASIWNPLEIIYAKLANHCWNNRFVKKLNGQFDFLGLDYYFHLRLNWRRPFIKNLNKKVTDQGWEIYPAGIKEVINNFSKFKKPLFIMENGLADAKDKFRAKFVADHLRYVHAAIQDGADVRGYFYWSLLDNFEWADGWPMKFGLYSVDRKTFQRAARPSAKTYAEICQNNELRVD